MKTKKVDENGDLVTKNGLFIYAYDLDAVLQTCEQSMKQQLRELQFDQKKGIEFLENGFLGDPNFQRFEAESRNTLLDVEGVLSVESFTHKQEDDVLLYTATIKTIYGIGVISWINLSE